MTEAEQDEFNSNVVLVAGDIAPNIWPLCLSFFDTAPVWRLNPVTPDLVLDSILKGQTQAHLGFVRSDKPAFLLVTHFEHYFDGRKSLFVDFFGADDFLAWQEKGFGYLDHFAKTHGCCAVEYVGRPGFSKVNPDFREDGRLYVKILEAQ